MYVISILLAFGVFCLVEKFVISIDKVMRRYTYRLIALKINMNVIIVLTLLFKDCAAVHFTFFKNLYLG